MKTIIAAAVAASLGIAALAQAAFDEQGLTPEEVAQHRARMARKAQRAAENGGYVTLAPTGRVIRVVSAQKRVAKSALDESINVFTTTLRLPVEWGDADETVKNPAKLAAAANADGRCGTAVVLIDDPSAPRLLVAPEEFWAAVNVARLAEDKPSSEQLARRLKQEFWRATCMVLGAYVSMQQPCLLTQISGNADLDRNICVIPSIEVLPKTKNAAKSRGIVPGKRAVYRKACEEGWAPAPTNDVQKAIWDKVHEMPTEPLKIKPETKKQDK